MCRTPPKLRTDRPKPQRMRGDDIAKLGEIIAIRLQIENCTATYQLQGDPESL